MKTAIRFQKPEIQISVMPVELLLLLPRLRPEKSVVMFVIIAVTQLYPVTSQAYFDPQVQVGDGQAQAYGQGLCLCLTLRGKNRKDFSPNERSKKFSRSLLSLDYILLQSEILTTPLGFYRAMHYVLGQFESNFTNNQLRGFALQSQNIGNLVQGEHPKLRVEQGLSRSSQQKTCNISETGQDRTKVTIND